MDAKLQIRGIVDSIELEKEIEKITKKDIKKISAKGFGGIDTIVYILSIGGGVLITQLANIITKIIEKDNIHEVTINGINIKGFSFTQTICEEISCLNFSCFSLSLLKITAQYFVRP